jgi:hypothetical protein
MALAAARTSAAASMTRSAALSIRRGETRASAAVQGLVELVHDPPGVSAGAPELLPQEHRSFLARHREPPPGAAASSSRVSSSANSATRPTFR